MEFQRKTNRLPRSEYRGMRTYFVTLCSQNRHAVFNNNQLSTRAIETLRHAASRHSFAVHAYCIMPDHVHMLVEGLTETSRLQLLIAWFKQRMAHSFREFSTNALWQRSYYDHILRPRDDASAVAWYIWMNPVRKEICSSPRDYPFSGSFTSAWLDQLVPENSWIPPWKEDAARNNPLQ